MERKNMFSKYLLKILLVISIFSTNIIFSEENEESDEDKYYKVNNSGKYSGENSGFENDEFFRYITRDGKPLYREPGTNKYYYRSQLNADYKSIYKSYQIVYNSDEQKMCLYSLDKDNGTGTKYNCSLFTEVDPTNVLIRHIDRLPVGITNVEDGSLQDGSYDVINGKQLRTAKQEIANILGGYVDEIGNLIGPTYTIQKKKYTNIYDVVSAIDKKLSEIPSFDAGIAGAIATANLPQVISTDRPYLIGVGTGFYNGAAAVSVGMSGVNKKGTVVFKFNGSINTQGQLGAGAGIGYTFGNTYEEEIVVKEKQKDENEITISKGELQELLNKTKTEAKNEVLDTLDKMGVLSKSNTKDDVLDVLKDMDVLTKDNAKDLFKDELEKTKNELKILISQNSGMNNENEWETVEKEIHLDGALPFTCDLEIGRCVIYGFEVDSPKTNSKEEEAIKGIVKALNERIEKASMTVVGHTDYVASEEYNQILGRQRAIAVMRLLKKYGLKEEIYFRNVESASEYLPLDNSKDKYARYINRRVELYLDGLILQKKDMKK